MATFPLIVEGQLTTPEELGRIVLRANQDGSSLELSEVANIEAGSQSYSMMMRGNGQNSTGAAIMLAPGANAVKTAEAVSAQIKELSLSMPEDIR